MLTTIKISTEKNGLIDITDAVTKAVAESGMTDGLVLVSVPHSTAGVTLMSPWDVLGLDDVQDEIDRLIPTRIDFKHQFDTPQDAAAHVKAAIVGHSRTIFLDAAKLGLGQSQHIYFWEFDGPRTRSVQIKIVGS